MVVLSMNRLIYTECTVFQLCRFFLVLKDRFSRIILCLILALSCSSLCPFQIDNPLSEEEEFPLFLPM